MNAGTHVLHSLLCRQNVYSHPDKIRKSGYIYALATWTAILIFMYSRSLNFPQNVICPWLLSISEGSIISPCYSKSWNNTACRLYLFLKEIKKIYIVQWQNERSRALFLLPKLPLYSCWILLYSCCFVLYSFYLLLCSCSLVLCRVVLVLSCVASCCTRVVSCCYSCSFLD